KMLIRVGDTLVMLVFVFVVDGVGRGISPKPELFDELLALFVGFQSLPCGALFTGDDVLNVLIHPAQKRFARVFLISGFLGLRLAFVVRFGFLSRDVDLQWIIDFLLVLGLLSSNSQTCCQKK